MANLPFKSANDDRRAIWRALFYSGQCGRQGAPRWVPKL